MRLARKITLALTLLAVVVLIAESAAEALRVWERVPTEMRQNHLLLGRTLTGSLRKAWKLELFIPAAALNGFDPETNRRLGFAYQVADYVRDDQFLGVGRDFPIGENPSLWATLVLQD